MIGNIGRIGVVLALACSACVFRAQALETQPLTHSESVDAHLQSDVSVLVYPLEDVRGGEYGRVYATTVIPVVNFFHVGGVNYYPETAGILRSNQAGKPTITVGALPTAFPYLLAEMMRDMRLATEVMAIDQLNTKADIASFDYVVMGKLRKTKLAYHINPIPLVFLAYLGAPYYFTNYEMEYELVVYRGDAIGEPVFEKNYKYRGGRAVGLYYNHSANFDLFIGSIERTLPEAVRAIAAAIATDLASRPPPQPEPPPEPPPEPEPPPKKKKKKK
jgi:hypothetical protein